MHEITIEQVLEWRPDRSQEELRALSGGRDSVDLRELLLSPLPHRDVFWIAVRCGALNEADLRRFVADCVFHVLPVWERAFQGDRRPHLCVDAARAHAAGVAGKDELRRVAAELREYADKTHHEPAEFVGAAALLATSYPLGPAQAELSLWCAADARPGEDAWQRKRFIHYLDGDQKPLTRKRKGRRGKGSLRSEILIRLAKNEDGPRIRELAHANGFQLVGIDFEDIYPYWQAVEYQGEIIAAAQLCPGKPIARMELLCVDPEVSHILRSLCCQRLYAGISASARAMGAKCVTGMIPEELPAYKKFLLRRGCKVVTTGDLILWRL